jgi:hypothetical protein
VPRIAEPAPPLPVPQNPPTSVDGQWSGMMSPNREPATVTIVQTEGTLTGTWAGTNSDGAFEQGALTGSYSPDGLLTMIWSTRSYLTCPIEVKGTVSGNVITASYATTACSASLVLGSITLTRQVQP